MSLLWPIFAVLTAVTLALLLRPLLRPAPPLLPRRDFDLRVYRHQLDELDRDRERGILAAAQTDAARTEIHRRILAAEMAETAAPARPVRQRWLAIVLAIGLPLLAFGLYALLGQPALPGQPFAARAADPAIQLSQAVDKLAARLALAPNGVGFRRLGDSYVALQRFPEAAQAYRRAQSMGVEDAEMLANFGEALTVENNGMVVPDARRLFQRCLALEPSNPQARFYLGLAETEIGDFRKAVAIWRDLESGAPPDAGWLPMLRQHIADAARQGGFDPSSVAAMAPPRPAGPDKESAAAIAAQPPAEQEKTIRAMVDGLAARLQQQPNDFDGWMRLARSYRVLGEAAKSEEAARRAIALKPDSTEALLGLAQTQMGDASEDALPAPFLATLRRVLALDKDNITALYYLGAGAATAQPAEARALWGRLLTLLPADQPERADLQKRYDSLAQPALR